MVQLLTSKLPALIVDDEHDLCELLSLSLSRFGIESDCCHGVAEAKQRLISKRYSFCLSDLKMEDGNGLDVIAAIKAHQPETPIAVMTAYGDIETATAAMKLGAFDFVSKPVDLKLLEKLANNALQLGTIEPTLTTAHHSEAQDNTDALSLLDGQSLVIQRLKDLLPKYARSLAPVYIQGPSGAGKERVAKTVHALSSRAKQAFVPVNCGAIPTNLIESELFGHKQGSFTGAEQDKKGLFQAAEGGTLFLDEIAELPLNVQVKLLRALQEKRIRAVGDNEETPVDVRIICATHQDLHTLTANKQFREDLFYRLNVLTVSVPALAERKEDLPVLIEHILKRLNSDITLADSALKSLEEYSFPGNIRELENILERAVALCENNLVTTEDLMLNPRNNSDLPMNAVISESENLDSQLENIEKKLIDQALQATGGNKTKAAEKLGISFRALRYKLSKQKSAD